MKRETRILSNVLVLNNNWIMIMKHFIRKRKHFIRRREKKRKKKTSVKIRTDDLRVLGPFSEALPQGKFVVPS